MRNATLQARDVRLALMGATLRVDNGTYTYREPYRIRNERYVAKVAARIKDAIPGVTILEAKDVMRAAPELSYFVVTFRLAEWSFLTSLDTDTPTTVYRHRVRRGKVLRANKTIVKLRRGIAQRQSGPARPHFL